MKEEIWKDIEGYEGLYQVSNLGNIRSFYTNPRYGYKNFESNNISIEGKNMRISTKANGYMYVTLRKDGKSKKKHIHRLVASAFIDNPNNFEQVNHKNFNKQDNRVNNLEWVTRAQNRRHWRESLKYKKDYKNKMVNITHKVVKKIKENKNDILNKRHEGKPVKEIAEELSLGRDFVREVLCLFED